jgi:hypothetical protein
MQPPTPLTLTHLQYLGQLSLILSKDDIGCTVVRNEVTRLRVVGGVDTTTDATSLGWGGECESVSVRVWTSITSV